MKNLCCVCEQICSVIFRSKEAGIKFPQLRNEVTASINNKEEIWIPIGAPSIHNSDFYRSVQNNPI
jgi:hypothetical protein